MTTGAIVTAVMFTLLAGAHSAAGESGFVKPLLNADWTIAELPRPTAERLLRGAWHLTSVAWLAMAVIAVGGTPLTAIAAAALVSALVIYLVGPGHPAWPAFLIAGAAGLRAEGILVDNVLLVGGAATVLVLLIAAGLHVYWAAGGNLGHLAAVPTAEDGSGPTFTPGPLLTLAVAGLLAGFAGLVVLVMADAGPVIWNRPLAAWLVMGGVAVLTARAIGDGHYAGFSKRYRDSTFGEMDDRVFTPIVVALALGATGTLLI